MRCSFFEEVRRKFVSDQKHLEKEKKPTKSSTLHYVSVCPSLPFCISLPIFNRDVDISTRGQRGLCACLLSFLRVSLAVFLVNLLVGPCGRAASREESLMKSLENVAREPRGEGGIFASPLLVAVDVGSDR